MAAQSAWLTDAPPPRDPTVGVGSVVPAAPATPLPGAQSAPVQSIPVTLVTPPSVQAPKVVPVVPQSVPTLVPGVPLVPRQPASISALNMSPAIGLSVQAVTVQPPIAPPPIVQNFVQPVPVLQSIPVIQSVTPQPVVRNVVASQVQTPFQPAPPVQQYVPQGQAVSYGQTVSAPPPHVPAAQPLGTSMFAPAVPAARPVETMQDTYTRYGQQSIAQATRTYASLSSAHEAQILSMDTTAGGLVPRKFPWKTFIFGMIIIVIVGSVLSMVWSVTQTTKKIATNLTSHTTELEQALAETEFVPKVEATYQNPMDKKKSYKNPFTTETNPFDEIEE